MAMLLISSLKRHKRVPTLSILPLKQHLHFAHRNPCHAIHQSFVSHFAIKTIHHRLFLLLLRCSPSLEFISHVPYLPLVIRDRFFDLCSKDGRKVKNALPLQSQAGLWKLQPSHPPARSLIGGDLA